MFNLNLIIMKTVVSNEEVLNFFFTKKQDTARNKQRNLFFHKDKLYSYGHHFCIARFIDENTVLFTERTYSNTTARQVRNAHWSAKCNNINLIYCYDPDLYTTENNLKQWKFDAEGLITKLSKARKPELYTVQLSRLADKVATYCKIMNIENSLVSLFVNP